MWSYLSLDKYLFEFVENWSFYNMFSKLQDDTVFIVENCL